MSTRSLALPDGTFQAIVGDRSFDLTFRDGQLFIDGDPVTYSFEPAGDACYALIVEGRSTPVVIESDQRSRVDVRIDGRRIGVDVKDERALLLDRFGFDAASASAEREIHAPMPGLVLSIAVEPGQAVKEGDGLIVLEAMKMENELRAHIDGVVKHIHVAPGDAVGKNDLLLELDA